MKIIVYDDNPEYGGHQIMACHGVEALASTPAHKVAFMHNPANERLANRLASISHLELLPTSHSTGKLQGLKNRFNQSRVSALAQQFIDLQVDLLLCIQGEIEASSLAILAARKARIECVSYLANPHSLTLMGAKLGRFRDRCNHYLINQPDRYITLSESMAQLLRDRGCTKPIGIVANGISTPPAQPSSLVKERPAMLGMLGRIEFKQKRQDFMVRVFCDYPQRFGNCRLLIAGGGPDRSRLQKLVSGCPRSNDITLLPWQDDPEPFYDSIDFLMIPSRFEGVPLVMLESLARGIPVIGSRRDGMRDLLPGEWTFEPGNATALAQTYAKVESAWQNRIEPLQRKIQTEMTLGAFKKAFRDAVAVPSFRK